MKTGIALAGGGSKGSYQTGVWKALRELGIDYDIVTGTSIGAINGAACGNQFGTEQVRVTDDDNAVMLGASRRFDGEQSG